MNIIYKKAAFLTFFIFVFTCANYLLAQDCSSLEVKAKIKSISDPNARDASIELSISGGQQPYAISWDNGMRGSKVENLSPGNYRYELTDANGCKKSFSHTIREIKQFQIRKIIDHAKDNVGSGQVELDVRGGQGPYSFYWFDEKMNVLNSDFTKANIRGLSEGKYQCAITDAQGFSNMIQIIIE